MGDWPADLRAEIERSWECIFDSGNYGRYDVWQATVHALHAEDVVMAVRIAGLTRTARYVSGQPGDRVAGNVMTHAGRDDDRTGTSGVALTPLDPTRAAQKAVALAQQERAPGSAPTSSSTWAGSCRARAWSTR